MECRTEACRVFNDIGLPTPAEIELTKYQALAAERAASLASSQSALNSALLSHSTLTTQFNSCESNLNTCMADYGYCISELNASTFNLTECKNTLASCNNTIATTYNASSTSNCTEWTNALNASIANITVISSLLTDCNNTLAACNNTLVTICNASVVQNTLLSYKNALKLDGIKNSMLICAMGGLYSSQVIKNYAGTDISIAQAFVSDLQAIAVASSSDPARCENMLMQMFLSGSYNKSCSNSFVNLKNISKTLADAASGELCLPTSGLVSKFFTQASSLVKLCAPGGQLVNGTPVSEAFEKDLEQIYPSSSNGAVYCMSKLLSIFESQGNFYSLQCNIFNFSNLLLVGDLWAIDAALVLCQ